MEHYDRSSERLKNLLHDVEAIKRACAEDKSCPFKEFEYGEYLFRFEYHNKNEKRYYWVNLSADYPNGTTLTSTINGGESQQGMKLFDLPLPFVFNSVAKELYREIAIPILCPSRPMDIDSPGHDGKDDDEEEEEDDDYDEDEDFNENNGYEDDRNICVIDNLEIIGHGHEEIREDFDLLRCYCDDALMNEIPSLDEVEISFTLSTNFLEDELARAWRLLPQVPIYIRVFFSYTKYCEDSSAARVECYQDKHDKICAGVLIQLQGILNHFVKSAVEERRSQYAQKDSKFKTSKKTPSKQLLAPPKNPKIPRLSASCTEQQPDSKSTPNLEQGLLVEIFSYAQQRLKTLNAYCVICDELHTFTNSAMLKPMVCDRALCVFSYQTLGVMSSVADDIAIETEVVDLLIAMAKAACASTRCNTIFEPYPTVVHPEKAQEFVFHSENKKTMDQVRAVMAKFIPMEAMTRMLGVELKTQLDSTDRLIYPLLQWIISSNRSHIVSLKPQQRLSFMKTPHQFLLRSSPPAKEAAFNKAKEIHGSCFAFHGSSIENWHSILRRGLINASGTSLQLNGAAYGKGIYLSPDASLSFSYSSFCRSLAKLPVPSGNVAAGQKNSRSAPQISSMLAEARRVKKQSVSLHLLPPQGIVCIALCEVVASKTLKKMSNSIWVMPDEDFVVTRFMFVFEDAEQKRISARSDDPHILAEIRKAIQ